MNIYCINNRTTKVFGMPLHNALVTLCKYDSNNDFMDYCYKHERNNAEYLNYINNNPKQQTFFM